MLRLHFLGRPRITLDGEPVDEFVSVKALTLLAYLAMGAGAHSRGALAGLFWGEMPEKRARANLRTALYNLQQLLPGYFEATRKTIAFNHEQPHFLDVIAFEMELKAASPLSDVGGLQAAVELYSGDFLESLHVAGAAAIQAWVRSHRERLRLGLLAALESLAGHHTTEGDWDAAIDVVRRSLAVEPWREESHRQLMHLLARTGQHSAALAQYEACREVLAAEFGVEPMPETTALYQRILRGRVQSNGRNLASLMMDVLTEMSRLLTNTGRSEKALALLAFVLRHPACQQETRDQAGALFNELSTTFPPEVVTVAKEQAEEGNFEDVVAGILASDLGSEATQHTDHYASPVTN